MTHSIAVRIRYIAAALLLSIFQLPAVAGELPIVENVALDGDQLTWDALSEATGYNVYQGSTYLATLYNERQFTVTEVGNYAVVAFNDDGDYTPLRGSTFVFFEDGEDNRPALNSVAGNFAYMTRRCFDVSAGETCVATCPDFIASSNGPGFFIGSATGGSCSSSGTNHVNSMIDADGYRCTVTSFTARVETIAVCAVR